MHQNIAGLASALVALLMSAPAQAVHYKFTIETGYQDGCAGVQSCTASPDSGFFTIRNAGPSAFTGIVGGSGTANVNAGLSFLSQFDGSLGIGESVTLGAGAESSNAGGFNGLDGALLFIKGVVSLDGQTTDLDLSVFDKDIHSGVFRVPGENGAPSDNGCGAGAFDNYVLEGGHPTCDTFDPWEISQPHGRYTFTNIAGVASPGTLLLLIPGLAAVRFGRRRGIA